MICIPLWQHPSDLRPRSQWDTLLHMSLHSRSLGSSTGVVPSANPAMDRQLLDIGTVQLVQAPPVDLPGFELYLSEILQALRLSQDFESLLLHLIDIRRSIALAGHHTPDLYRVSVQPA